MIMPWAALRDRNLAMNPLLPASCPLALASAPARSLLAASASGPPADSCWVTRAMAARSVRISWNLMMTQATHMPPRTHMKEMRVAAGRPLLWMMRDVAAGRYKICSTASVVVMCVEVN